MERYIDRDVLLQAIDSNADDICYGVPAWERELTLANIRRVIDKVAGDYDEPDRKIEWTAEDVMDAKAAMRVLSPSIAQEVQWRKDGNAYICGPGGSVLASTSAFPSLGIGETIRLDEIV